MARVVGSLSSLFIGFIVVGVAVIFAFSWSFDGIPAAGWHWTMMAVVVALMLVYGALLWMRSRAAQAAEGDGETFYYLGFIYTLATLIATFAPLLSSAERLEARRVLGLFGLGLITTFVGLAGRIVFHQTSPERAVGPEDSARDLGNAYAEAARAIERSTVRIVHAQQRAEAHLNESYSGAIDAIRQLSDRATEHVDAMTARVLERFSGAIERVTTDAEATFAELRNRSVHEIEAASGQVAKTQHMVREQIEGLAANAAGAVRGVTEQAVADFDKIARASTAELTAFLRQTSGSVTTALQELETRLAALRLPPEDTTDKLVASLTELAERTEVLRRTTAVVGAAYTDLEGTLAGAVQRAQDGSRALGALAESADAATTAVTSARTNVEHFATQLGQVGQLASGLENLPADARPIIATLSTLRASLGEATSAWAEVAGVTEGASKSIASAGAALSALEERTRAAERSVVDWSGGLTRAGAGLVALSEVAERVVQLGQDAVANQTQLSAEISGPLADQLRKHSEAAGALAERLQEDIRNSEEAVRKVHHHLIDASRFILSRVEYRR
jgi:hypothetical protein